MRTEVREVSSKGSSSLVEWVDDDGNVNRATVPSTQLYTEEGLVYVNDPENGALYGEDWEGLIRARLGPKGIAGLLRKAGVWTYEDFLNNTSAVNGAFREACQANYQAFVDTVHARQSARETQEGKE